MPHAARVVAASSSLLNRPEPDEIANDPILCLAISTSQSRSRLRVPEITQSTGYLAEGSSGVGESDPLLGSVGGIKVRRKPFYRPRPLWIVPFAILASITRGMTIAPRVEVFTQLSCNAIYGRLPQYSHNTELHQSPIVFPRSSEAIEGTAVPSTIHSAIDSHQYGSPSFTDDAGGDGDSDEDEDPLRIPSKRCLSDPKVQANAARLQTIMATAVGLCSALTTGFWGHFGEQHGRTRVLAATTFGLLLTDLVFVLVSLPRSPLAVHGHKLLIIAPAIEGLLGGWSTLQGATSAYISDCTSDGSRAHIFSRFHGVFYFGFALGPMLGAWIITHPPIFLRPLLQLETATAGRTVTPVFWIAVCFSLTNFLQSIFVIPESLGKKTKHNAKDVEATAARLIDSEVYNSAAGTSARGRDIDQTTSKTDSGGILSGMKGIFKPLLVFAPKIRPNGRDWNMTLLALALFGFLLSSGIFQLKYLYAEHVFAWEAEQLSYYITFVGGARSLHLLFLMPLIISYFKPKPKKGSATNPQQADGGNKKSKSKPKPTRAQLITEMKFDLRITRLSYALDILSHTLVSLSSTAPTVHAQVAFVGFTVLSSFSSGVLPGMHSLAMCVMQAESVEDEADELRRSADGVVRKPSGSANGNGVVAAGSLFGALAVLQATGQMILGPMLFGMVYSMTVARFPKAIFVLAASILLVSLLLLSRVHPHYPHPSSRSHPHMHPNARNGISAEMRKQVLRFSKGKSGRGYGHEYAYRPGHRSPGEDEVERGRSRVSKDLSGANGGLSSGPRPGGYTAPIRQCTTSRGDCNSNYGALEAGRTCGST